MLICVPDAADRRTASPTWARSTPPAKALGAGAPAGSAGRARVDHLPGHDARAAGAAARAALGPEGRHGLNVAFSPERVDPGRTDYTLRNTPKVSAGSPPACTDRAAELYGRVCDHIVRVSTPEAAEMTKLLENIFRSVNIALVNELAILADRMGIDIWEVVDAAATKPYGFMRFEPGPGMGGHCLPVDPFYLTWRAREFHMSTEFIELAGKINQQMPYHCVERIERALNDVAKPVKGSRILILGASYKGGVGDIRESPALRIIEVLAERGANRQLPRPVRPVAPELGPRERAARRRRRRRRRGRAGHRPPRHRPRVHRRPERAVRRPPRRHPRHAGREPRSSVAPAARATGVPPAPPDARCAQVRRIASSPGA